LIRALIRLKNNQKNDKYSSSFSKTGISIGLHRSYVPIGPIRKKIEWNLNNSIIFGN